MHTKFTSFYLEKRINCLRPTIQTLYFPFLSFLKRGVIITRLATLTFQGIKTQRLC